MADEIEIDIDIERKRGGAGRADLKELAALAGAPSAPSRRPAAIPATADSSGFVDLAAFSANDPNWVDRELAKVRTYADESALAMPSSNARGRSLAPGSLAPLALTDLVGKTDDVAIIAGVRKRNKAGVVLALLSVVALGAMGFGYVKYQKEQSAKRTAAASLVANAPQAPLPNAVGSALPTALPGAAAAIRPPAPQSANPATAAAPDPAPAAQAANEPPSSAEKADAKDAKESKKSSAKKKGLALATGSAASRSAAPSKAHTSAPAASPAPAPKGAAASKPASGGSGSLLDLMKASVANGAKKK